MYPYFVLGYLCNKYKLNDRYSKVYKNTYSLLVIGAIYFVMLSFFGNEIYIYVSGYTIIGKNIINQLGIDLFRFSIGLVGSVFILIALYKLYINQTFNKLLHKNNFIITIGQSTLGIYIISDFINLYVLSRVMKTMDGINYMAILVETILVLLTSIVAIKIIKKNNILNRLLLGGNK